MTHRLGRLLLLAGTGAALSCGRPAPRAIAYGDELCAHCHMVVADPRFAGQLVTTRGLVYTFDDIECLASFVAAGDLSASRIHSLWVNDFNRPGIRLNAVEARYWRNERLRTPMSSGLVAFSPGSESDSVGASTRVTLESWEDVVIRVRRSGMHRGHQPVALAPSSASESVPPGPPADVVVDPSGPVRTLSAALRLAPRHGRILVRPGTYRESRIQVTRPVTIEGEGWPTLVGGEHEVLTVTADSVTIRGLTISGVVPSAAEDRAGIRFTGARHCTVENTRLIGTVFGIYMAQSSDCRIAGNVFRGQGTLQGLSGNAIHSWDSKDLIVERNDIQGHRDGIYLEFTTGSRVRGNRSVSNLRYGLHFMFSHSCEYTDNLFQRNGAGVAVMFSDSVVMRRNRFERSWGSAAYGLLLKELRDSRIEQNQFQGNTVGLWTEGTSRVLVSRNRFIANGWAVRVLGDATDNEFRGNQFRGNTFDVGTALGENSNRFEANYWDQYRGYDYDRDGYGDIPFQPVRLFSLLIQENEPALILLHSFFIELLDLAEQMVPTLAPRSLQDARPLMRWDS